MGCQATPCRARNDVCCDLVQIPYPHTPSDKIWSYNECYAEMPRVKFKNPRWPSLLATGHPPFLGCSILQAVTSLFEP